MVRCGWVERGLEVEGGMESRVDGHHLRHRPRVGNTGGEEAGPQSTGCQEQDRNSISVTQADTRVAEREISEDDREREGGRGRGERKGKRRDATRPRKRKRSE